MSKVEKESLDLSSTGGGKATPLGAIAKNPNPVEKEIVEQNETSNQTDIPKYDLFGGGEKEIEEAGNKEEDTSVEEIEKEVLEGTDTKEELEEVGENKPEEESEEEEEAEEEEDLNVYYYIAQQLAKDGELPEDFEVTEDIKGDTIYSKYKETIKEDATAEIQNEVLQALAAEGYNAGDLQYAKLLRSGVDPKTLQTAAQYENHAGINLEEATEDIKTSTIKAMYQDRGMGDEEILAIVEKAELDDKLDAFAKKAKDYFTDKHKGILETEQANAKAREEEQAKIQEARLSRIQNVLKEGKVLDEKIPDVKTFQRALYDKTETVEIGGQTYTASPFQLFQLQYDNNPEVQLWAFKQMMYRGENSSKLKKQVEAEVERDLFEAMKTDLAEKKKKTSKVKQKLETTTNMWS